MARNPLIMQRQQTSLISGNQLPQASANPRSPDYSGLNQLAARFIGRVNRDNAEDDADQKKRDKLAAIEAGTLRGNDPALMGQSVDWYNDAFSPEGLAAEKAARQNLTMNKVQNIVVGRIAEIEAMTGKTADEKAALMREALNGAMGEIDPTFSAAPRQWGEDYITQTHRRIALKDKAMQDQALVDEINTVVNDTIKTASTAALNGEDASFHIKIVEERLNDLIAMNRMTPEARDVKLREVLSIVAGSQLQGDLTNELYSGNVSPDDMHQWAVALEAGVDETLKVHSPTHPGLEQVERYKTDDVREMLNDEQTTQGVSVAARKVVQLFQEGASQRAKRIEIDAWLRDPNRDPTTTMPSEHRNEVNKITQEELEKNTPESLFRATNLAMQSGYVPDELSDYWIDNIESGSAERLDQTLKAYHFLRSSKRGLQTLRTLPKEKREQLDMYATAAEYFGTDPNDPQTAERMQLFMTEMQDPNGITYENISEQWSRGDVTESLTNTLFDNFEEDFGLEIIDNRYIAEVKTAIHVIYLTNRFSANKTDTLEGIVEKARALVNERYDKEEIDKPGDYRLLMGTSKDFGQLQDPEGISDMLLSVLPAVGKNSDGANTFIHGFIKNEILDALTLGETSLDADERRALEAQVMDNQIGYTIRISKVDRYGHGGNYFLHVNLGNGFEMLRDKEGRAIEIDPLSEKQRLQAVAAEKAKREAMEKAANLTHQKNMHEAYKDLPFEDQLDLSEKHGRMRLQVGENPNDIFLESLPPELEEAVKDRREQVIESIKKYNLDKEVQYRRLLPNTLTAKKVGLPMSVDELVVASKKDQKEALKKAKEEGGDALLEQVQAQLEAPGAGAVTYANYADRDAAIQGTMVPKGKGIDVIYSAVMLVEEIIPDGTGGQMMMRTAAAESRFGEHKGSYRPKGDRGPFQINDGDNAGYTEVIRRSNIEGDKLNIAAKQLVEAGLPDVRTATRYDLDSPLISAMFARLYYLSRPRNIPTDVLEQAKFWKTDYNTRLGDGSVADFMAAANSFEMPGRRTPHVENVGRVVDYSTGNPFPARFNQATVELQTAAISLSAAFGKDLKITPNGGVRPPGSTSQHSHRRAIDVNVMAYSDEEKTRLIALAIGKAGFRGIGGYSAGDGKGTLHFDVRPNVGQGPEGLALWWWHQPGGVGNQSWTTAPQWYQDGINLGLAMRRSNAEPSI